MPALKTVDFRSMFERENFALHVGDIVSQDPYLDLSSYRQTHKSNMHKTVLSAQSSWIVMLFSIFSRMKSIPVHSHVRPDGAYTWRR